MKFFSKNVNGENSSRELFQEQNSFRLKTTPKDDFPNLHWKDMKI